MMPARDPRLDEAKAIPMAEVLHRLDLPGLKPAGRERVGPCPRCGGRDRFAVNTDSGQWLCRGCDAQAELGADGLGLVRHVLACDFRAALDWLVGAAEVRLSPEEEERRAREREQAKEASDREAARRRRAAIRRAQEIWKGCQPAGLLVEGYLARRGLPDWLVDAPPPCLRFHPDLPYMVSDGGTWVEAHRGPAMVAAIQAPDGEVTAVHRTWLDLSRPNGKADICWQGEALNPKTIWGSKKGAAIRLSPAPKEGCTTMVMGEGIETTLTAMAAWEGRTGVAFWAGVDLGNMSGRRILRGEGMKYAGIPDLEDERAFLPPPWIDWLVFIQDGDSEPRTTRAKLEAGLRRARWHKPGLRISIIHPGEGRDLNDVAMAGVGQ